MGGQTLDRTGPQVDPSAWSSVKPYNFKTEESSVIEQCTGCYSAEKRQQSIYPEDARPKDSAEAAAQAGESRRNHIHQDLNPAFGQVGRPCNTSASGK
jgi:hypothetical protein